MRMFAPITFAYILIASTSALAQKATLEVPMGLGMGNAGAYRVMGVAPDGTVRVQMTQETPPPMRTLLGKAEGHYIMLTRPATPEGNPGVFRVQVTDVGPDAVLSFKMSPAAAKLLVMNSMVELYRPDGATTAIMKNLPETIPLATGQAGANVDERQVASRMRSINNLKQIGLAMHNFHSVHGRFPPAVIMGPDGKPWHSWRVLILPYLEQEQLFKQYDFGQPWDSAKNRMVLDKMPDVFREPVYGDAAGNFTHYAAVTGVDRAPFSSKGPVQRDAQNVPMAQGIGLSDYTDGTSNTVIVVPIDPARKVPWTKPEDIVVGPKYPDDYDLFGKPNGIAAPYTIGSVKGGPPCGPFLWADGSVRVVAQTINKNVLAALFTRNGGEVISADAIPGDNQPAPIARAVKVQVDGRKATAVMGTMSMPGGR